jgi:N-acetylglucosamine-6-phosphate deacetylase
MYEEFFREGTCLFLPTLATNTIDVFKKGIDAVRAYWKKGGKGVYGLHLEGPWLNEIKKGAHVKEWIHSPTIEEIKNLLEYGNDVIKMITIAPEVCSDEVIELLLSHHIILSAGHSNATYVEAIDGFNKGISAVTHLYNAMSPLQHRQPGLVGATFNHQKIKASIIPDGYHVDFAAISIAKKIMGERLFAITDAVTETNTGPYQHQLAGDKYECNGVLSGSALSMHKAFKNLVEYSGIDVEEALRMCSLYPAQLLGCDDQYGKIVPQVAGQFLILNKQLNLVEVITTL